METDSRSAWQCYTTGKEAQDAMYAACEKAETNICCEQYIFSDDEAGRKFAELFIRKAESGVKVRLLIDHVGSSDLHGSDTQIKLEAAGVEVRFFNIVRPWRLNNFSSWFFRDHRKVLTVDGKVGFIGGVGIRKDMENWRDTHIQIEGDLATGMEKSFDQMWKKSQYKIFFRLKKFQLSETGFSLVTNAPRFRHRLIYHHLIAAISKAKSSLYLTTPYFVPDGRFFRAIRHASRRGVKVTLLVPEVSDVPLFNFAAHSYFARALSSGIRIFQYQKSFLHSKVVIVDETFATVGSTNLDNMSFLWNYEINIESTDKVFVDELTENFFEDLENAKEMSLEEWKKRPVIRKIFEFLSLPFHQLL